ncbi:MAG: DUF3822 family protein [Saprospiraceae bacterium]|nr:DUF3822 family protein [Saprospiraceae bacterium]
MPAQTNPPELIISLSRDKVRLQLMEEPTTGRASWESEFPVYNTFLEDHVSLALDTALQQNPSLVEHFDHVEILLIDRPNICIPQYYKHNGMLQGIAGKYLRLRAGDTLTTDSTSDDTVIAYTLPTDTINVLREYYANIGQVHLTSVLWTAITLQENTVSKDSTGLFFCLSGNTLLVLGETAGKLAFSKSFYIQDQSDLAYYAVACSRLLRMKLNWLVLVGDESPLFEMPRVPNFAIDRQLKLPALHSLIASHRSCAS